MMRTLLLALLATTAQAQVIPDPSTPDASVAEAAASDTPAAVGWSAQAGHRVEVLGGGRPAWHETRVGVHRRLQSLALGVEAARIERHGVTDATVALDGYRVLSPRAYLNVRAEGTPQSRVVPNLSALAQLYASVAPGWEATAGVRHVAVPGDYTTLLTGGIARSVGPFALGAQATVGVDPAGTVSGLLSARYQPDPPPRGPATRATLLVGQAQEAVADEQGAVRVREQWIVSVSGQRAVAGAVGVTAGASVLADGSRTRWGVEAGLVARW